MKKAILFLLICLSISVAYSQKIVKEHYTVSGGFLGALNFSKFRIGGDNTGNVKYDMSTGWAAGAWLNFPVSNGFSIEPQVLYNKYKYKSDVNPLLLDDGTITYISVPLLFKLHLGSALAISVGPQFDFFSTFKDEHNNAQKDDFKSSSVDITGGLELFPHGRITFFGRYVHGLTNMDNTGNPNTAIEYYNQAITAGLKLKLFGKKIPADSDGDGVPDPKDKCPNIAGLARYDGCPIPDKDGDGINDEEDKCPDVPGVAKYGGCPIPDKDGDGINDEEDKCPDVAGLAKYGGCPIPDTDGDGVNDEEDQCPNQAGLVKYHGCPIPDTDGDGINDEEDKCPNIPGVAEQQGCPAITEEVTKKVNFAASNVYFATGSSKLLSRSYSGLNVVVSILQENADLKLKIDGHTDNTGADDMNMRLSEARAASVKAYLESKGIDPSRLESEGFGETMPVADNKTSAGRQKNRRVEIKVHY